MARVYLHLVGARPLVIDSRAGRVRVHDADPFGELAERLLKILAAQGQTTQDDAQPGHPFYGNQYVEVAGQHVEVPKSGGTKAKVHELLSKGHKFTFEELSNVLGNPPEKALKNALSELKNPKWAGPKGALDIVKGADGKFHVVKQDGTPAAAAPTTALEEPAAPAAPIAAPAAPESDPFTNFKLDEPVPGEVAKAAAKAPEPEPAPAVHPGISLPAPHKAQPAGNSAKPKVQADKDYNAALMTSLGEAQAAAKTMPASAAKDIALTFKQKKANAMAQWSADTSMNASAAKQQEVFKADLKLVDNLAQGMDLNAAFVQWKNDTAAEKMGTLDKPAPPPSTPSAPKPAPASKPLPSTLTIKNPHEPALPAVPAHGAYVPHDHKGVSAEDFAIKSGSVAATAFGSKMSSLKEKLYADHQDSVKNKQGVQQRLEKRLQDSPHWGWMSKEHKSSYGSLAATLISSWASSSGDSHPLSVSQQLAVQEVFGMGNHEVEKGSLHTLAQNGHDADAVHRLAALNLNLNVSTPERFASFKSGLHDFIRAQYHETQDHFKQMGISEVHLVRGMSVSGASAHAQAKEVKLKLQPASSFSTNYSTAKGFAKGQSLFLVKVPASQVLGSFVTGFGCTNEHEVVVLAHPETKAVHIGYANAGTMSEAAINISKTLGSGTAPTTSGKPPKFKYVPPLKPKGINATWAKNIKEAAMTHEPDKVKALIAQMEESGLKLPKSKAYAQQVHQDLIKSLAAHAAQFGTKS